jgi:pentatricopeptide repeat protein
MQQAEARAKDAKARGDLLSGSMALLRRMEAEAAEAAEATAAGASAAAGTGSAGPAPDARTYTTLISISTRLGRPELADKMLTRMHEAGLAGTARGGDGTAKAYRRLMAGPLVGGGSTEDDCVFTAKAYRRLMAGLYAKAHDDGEVGQQLQKNHDWAAHEDTFRDMTNLGHTPTSVDIDQLVRLRMDPSDPTSLNNELSFVQNCFNMFNVTPSPSTMFELLQAAVRLGDVATAQRAGGLIRQLGLDEGRLERLQEMFEFEL